MQNIGKDALQLNRVCADDAGLQGQLHCQALLAVFLPVSADKFLNVLVHCQLLRRIGAFPQIDFREQKQLGNHVLQLFRLAPDNAQVSPLSLRRFGNAVQKALYIGLYGG